MKVSLKWLSEYVSPPPLEELVRRLTMAGLEVEGVERPGAGLAGVVVAQILESRPHPNADKLSVTKVDAGGGEPLQIVCGAKNYQVGDKVPLATVGTKLPSGTEIKKAALRGVDSSGMLCSQRELGLSEEASGLYILDPGLKPGTPIAQALGLDDAVLEVNVTPNRPDALSHLGIAREVAVLTRQPLRRPEARPHEGPRATSEAVKIRIEDSARSRCPRYAGRVVEGVTVGPSPSWLKQRLEACGVRSINNVVDVTNYVMLESGQPLHAFDLDKVGGAEIVVRLAKPGEKLVSLDGKARELDPDDLVIADREKATGIGGVMGGAESEVSEKTARVLLEVANFQPATVRRSAKRHGLHTEASHRFERGVDVDGVPWVIDRAAALLAELGKGTVLKGRVDVYPVPVASRQVRLRHAKVAGLLGVEVPRDESRRILEALGFKAVTSGAEATTYQVPAFRVDVEREEDLVEEVGRVFGYEEIPVRMPRALARLLPEPKDVAAHARMREALGGHGFDEVLNYSFISPREQPWVAPGPLERMGQEREWIQLSNPLSLEQSVMRESLYAGLLQNVARNLRHQPATLRFYELGRVYRADPGGGKKRRPVAQEPTHAAGVLWGLREGRAWTAPKGEGAGSAAAAAAAVDFYDAKGAVEAVLEGLGIGGARFEPREGVPYHPRASAVVKLGETEVGTLGELHPKVARAFGVPEGIYLFELDADALCAQARLEPAFEEIGKYPAVLRDLAVVVDAEMPHDALRAVIREVGGELLEEAAVFDVYTGKPIPEGKKNVAYALRYRAKDRTLTDAEVNEAHGRIVEEVNRRLKGSLRA
ncbi:MAG TPA: phenylalanine--tRNA ligase subunit beta [Myxococcales bacterium]|nr:phenylalanine--tRNA ligase subunit beta [Myxococcales bacterium]